MTQTRLHWKRWTAIVAGVALLLVAWALHGPILRGMASPLIADDPGDDFQCIAIVAWNHHPSGHGCYDTAAGMYHAKPTSRVVIVEPRHTRLIQTGILPSFEALSRREMVARGVVNDAISVIQSDGNDNWANARGLKSWLAERPEATIVVLCAAFHSAQLRYALNAVLAPTNAARVRVRPLDEPTCNASNWWTSRDGFKKFGMGWLRLLHAWCLQTGSVPPPCGNADEYEAGALRTLREGTS